MEDSRRTLRLQKFTQCSYLIRERKILVHFLNLGLILINIGFVIIGSFTVTSVFTFNLEAADWRSYRIEQIKNGEMEGGKIDKWVCRDLGTCTAAASLEARQINNTPFAFQACNKFFQ